MSRKKTDSIDKIQSVMFDKKKWSKNKAVEWLKSTPFISNYPKHNPRITDNYYRFRQYDPARFKEYRIFNFGNGIKLIMGI